MKKLFLLPIVLGSCGPLPPVPPPSTVTCGQVCAHLRALGCEEGNPTPAGATCEEVCELIQTSGIVSWDLECRAAISECSELDDCEE